MTQQLIEKIDNNTDLAQWHQAVAFLTEPSLTAKLTSYVGTPIEYLMNKLPAGAHNLIKFAMKSNHCHDNKVLQNKFSGSPKRIFQRFGLPENLSLKHPFFIR